MKPLALLLLALPLAAVEIQVSPTGRDDADGAPGRPVATLARAQALARTLVANHPADGVAVVLGEGTWRLAEPLVFTAADGGGEGQPVVWRAAPGSRPVITGAVALGPWEPQDKGRWCATVPTGVTADHLLLAGAWVPPAGADIPLTGLERDPAAPAGTGWTFTVGAGPLPDLQRGPVRLELLRSWSSFLARVAAIDGAHRRLVLDPRAWIAPQKSPTPNTVNAANLRHLRLRLEGHVDLLTDGTWATDAAGRVVLQLPPGQRPGPAETPRTPCLLTIAGTAEHPVVGLRFQGLTLTGAGWRLPDIGSYDRQAAVAPTPEGVTAGPEPAAVSAAHWRRGGMAGCHLTGNAGHGVVLGAGCQDVVLERCLVEDTGGNGLAIGGHREPDPATAPLTSRITVQDSLVRRYGRVRAGAVGIWIGIARDCSVVHNEVAEGRYTGISVGWRWEPTPGASEGHLIQANHIHHVMERLCDGAGIYALGRQPGGRILDNAVHDVHRHPEAHTSAICGIYLDEGSLGWTISGNQLWGIDDRAINLHRPGLAAGPTAVPDTSLPNRITGNHLLLHADGTAGQRQPPYGKKQILYGPTEVDDQVVEWRGNHVLNEAPGVPATVGPREPPGPR